MGQTTLEHGICVYSILHIYMYIYIYVYIYGQYICVGRYSMYTYYIKKNIYIYVIAVFHRGVYTYNNNIDNIHSNNI